MRRITQKVVKRLESKFNCDPSCLLVGMGPCIGPYCYEVGEDVRMFFEKQDLSTKEFSSLSLRRGKYLFDLRESNRSQLLSLGIKKENIFSLDICNHCYLDLYSYRRDGDKRRRLINFIGLLF